MKVFLGGTCNESMWREFVKARIECEYFDPVVDDWNEEARKRERYEREHCDYVLYTITPRMREYILLQKLLMIATSDQKRRSYVS